MMKLLAVTLIVGAVAGVAFAQAKVDPNVPTYEKVSGVSGNLAGVGSDTLLNMMTLWMEEFEKIYPNVKTSYKGEGSGTAPPALIEGTAQLGPMSRKMKDGELDAFEKKYGFKPTTLNVAVDCVAVFVNKDNPVKGLTMPQLDCIFSQTQNSGYRNITTWGQVGLDGEWENMPISLYGRNSVSGTYAFFKKHALFKGDYKDTVKEQPGSAAVVNGVANDKAGIGYSGIGYKTADVRALPVAATHEDPLAEPTFENALAGKYPLGRTLMVNVVKKPNEPLPQLVQEFIKFVMSKQGQEVVVKDGFGPLSPDQIKKELAKVGIEE
jgi:phosphate transport system substrate-binding protein